MVPDILNVPGPNAITSLPDRRRQPVTGRHVADTFAADHRRGTVES